MNLSDQVCSLELAKRLKELDVKQNSYFYWYLLNEEWEIEMDAYGLKELDKISAFKVAELGDSLLECSVNNNSNIELDFYHTYDGYNITIKPFRITGIQSSYIIRDMKEADARAKALIWLVECEYMHYNP